MAASSGLAMAIASLADPLTASETPIRILPFSNRHARRKRNLYWHARAGQAAAHPRLPSLSFVRPRRRLSFAPTACHRSRRAQMPSRLAALQRPPKARPLRHRARRHAGGVGSNILVVVVLRRSSPDPTSQFRFRLSLQQAGSGTGKFSKMRARNNIKMGDHTYKLDKLILPVRNLISVNIKLIR
jgi:hypothetical protein